MREILNVYKIIATNNNIIGGFILNHLPEGLLIPYPHHCYLITRSEKSNEVPDNIIISTPSQKPKVFLIQPLVLNQEIRVSKNQGKIIPEIFILHGFSDYIKNKYNTKKEEQVEKYAEEIVNSLLEFIKFEPQ